MMIKIVLYLLFLMVILNGNVSNYDKLFSYLQNNNIIIGQDIDEKKLFDLINDEKLFNSSNFDVSSLNNKINKLIIVQEKKLKKVNIFVNSNPNSKINKEVKNYINDNDERISKTQTNFKNSSEDSFFTKIINDILDMMKFNKD